MDVDEQPWEGPPPKRFLVLLFVDWLTAFVAAPQGDPGEKRSARMYPVNSKLLGLVVCGWFCCAAPADAGDRRPLTLEETQIAKAFDTAVRGDATLKSFSSLLGLRTLKYSIPKFFSY